MPDRLSPSWVRTIKEAMTSTPSDGVLVPSFLQDAIVAAPSDFRFEWIDTGLLIHHLMDEPMFFPKLSYIQAVI